MFQKWIHSLFHQRGEQKIVFRFRHHKKTMLWWFLNALAFLMDNCWNIDGCFCHNNGPFQQNCTYTSLCSATIICSRMLLVWQLIARKNIANSFNVCNAFCEVVLLVNSQIVSAYVFHFLRMCEWVYVVSVLHVVIFMMEAVRLFHDRTKELCQKKTPKCTVFFIAIE